MARSMPRSKAVRVLGGALVTAAVPLLRAAPGSGASTRPVQYPVPKKCADYHEGPTCPKLCCRDCPPIPSGGNPGVLKWCCSKGDACDFEAPSSQYRCGRVRCKTVCPANRKCGSKCCEPGSVCADPDLEFCCEARERACRGGGTVSCCKSNEHCCRGVCCPSGTRCAPGSGRGKCTPCPKGSRKCGEDLLREGRAVLWREVLLEAAEVLPVGHLLQEIRHLLRRDVLHRQADLLRGPLLYETEVVLR